MNRELASVAENDSKPPRSTAASTGITSRLIPPTVTWVIGATRIPATPASAAPTVHVAEDTSPGEMPRVAAPRSLCETAAVTQPTRVNRQTTVSTAVSAITISSSHT